MDEVSHIIDLPIDAVPIVLAAGWALKRKD